MSSCFRDGQISGPYDILAAFYAVITDRVIWLEGPDAAVIPPLPPLHLKPPQPAFPRKNPDHPEAPGFDPELPI